MWARTVRVISIGKYSQSRVSTSRLAGLKNFNRLWGTGFVLSFLVLNFGVIRERNRPIKRETGVMGSALVGLHMKGAPQASCLLFSYRLTLSELLSR